jgi:hypothetical protein
MAVPGTVDVDVDIDDDVDDDVDLDLDSSVELDGSEAIRRRCPHRRPRPVVAIRRGCGTGSVDVQRRGWAQRRTSPSTSTLWVNDQVDVDDHERHVEDL